MKIVSAKNKKPTNKLKVGTQNKLYKNIRFKISLQLF